MKQGLTGAELARRIGVLPKDIWRYESGRVKSPSADVVGRIGEALGVSTDFLIHGSSDSTVTPPDAAE
ncbi:MAG: helix-turn-helix transcriptional regulator [Gammaproteobacteria bacterium]|nr:helix-turn-helix transcriptional regulator [Gammaproteobacteria bacterium]